MTEKSLWLPSTGTLIYDPPRPGMRKDKTERWCVVNVDNEIARYYAYWIEKTFNTKLDMPAWGAHITVVGGVKNAIGLKPEMWKFNDRENISFLYEVYPQTYDVKSKNIKPFWYIKVKCPKLSKIRASLGLKPDYPFHITVGRTKEKVDTNIYPFIRYV